MLEYNQLLARFLEILRTEYGLELLCCARYSFYCTLLLSELFLPSSEFVPYSGILHLPDYLFLSRLL